MKAVVRPLAQYQLGSQGIKSASSIPGWACLSSKSSYFSMYCSEGVTGSIAHLTTPHPWFTAHLVPAPTHQMLNMVMVTIPHLVSRVYQMGSIANEGEAFAIRTEVVRLLVGVGKMTCNRRLVGYS